MATQPQNRQAGDTYSGMLSAGNYPPELRRQGVDEAAKLTYLTRDISAFSYLIHKNKLTAKKIVKDRMFKTRELSELMRYYTVAIGSNIAGVTADPFHRIIALPNAEAAEIQPENLFYALGLFAQVASDRMVAGQVIPAQGAVQGTNIGPDLGWDVGGNPTGVRFSRIKGLNADGRYYEDYEQLYCSAKGAPNSGGLGFTLITLERCYMGPSEEDAGGRLIPRGLVYSANAITGDNNGGINHVGNTAAVINAGDVLLRATPVATEGTNAPNGVHKNPTMDENFTQEYKYAVDRTKESMITDKALWINQNGMDINRWLTTRQANRDREYSNLLGRKTRHAVSGGREQYITGGVRPYIMKDAKHIIVYPGATITWPGLLDLGKQIFGLGGSQERIGFTGITMDAELRKSFWNEHLFYNEKVSKEFNMEVNTLHVSGGKIHLIVSQVMEENGYGNEILCLDMSNKDAFEPVTNEGWDYKVEKNIQEPGAQIYKEQIIGMFGLMRRYKPFHCILDFSNAVAVPVTSQPLTP